MDIAIRAGQPNRGWQAVLGRRSSAAAVRTPSSAAALATTSHGTAHDADAPQTPAVAGGCRRAPRGVVRGAGADLSGPSDLAGHPLPAGRRVRCDRAPLGRQGESAPRHHRGREHRQRRRTRGTTAVARAQPDGYTILLGGIPVSSSIRSRRARSPMIRSRISSRSRWSAATRPSSTCIPRSRSIRSRSWPTSPNRTPASCPTGRPASARPIISSANCSSRSPAPTSRMCPIAARGRH